MYGCLKTPVNNRSREGAQSLGFGSANPDMELRKSPGSRLNSSCCKNVLRDRSGLSGNVTEGGARGGRSGWGDDAQLSGRTDRGPSLANAPEPGFPGGVS